MSSATPDSLQVIHQFDVSPERVFAAWLDPESASRWLFATATGRMVRAEIDPRVGGFFYLTDRRDGEDVEHVGEYLEIESPRRLVFKMSVPKYSPVSTRVTVAILPLGSGCQLTLTHDGVLPEYVSRTEAGWGMILEALAKTLG
ncbi:SRPBCC family protein [Singulisphaera sp. Ch08]|uniref:SRPBCC family protein n=1 Tax=Singulisphaera sp. Ch08 TaxID=3120278 RepID=A0AAU7C7X7_9BACT